MVDIHLPALSGGSARVVRWLVESGGPVEAGAPLVIVVTERAEVLLPAPAAGVLADPVPVGMTVEPGSLLARLEPAAGEGPSVGRQDTLRSDEGLALTPQPPLPFAARQEGGRERRGVPVRATPLARRIAETHGVDLGTVTGTGPAGRVDAADVKPLASKPSLAPSWKRAERALMEASGASAHGSEPEASAHRCVPVATAVVELDVGAALAAVAALRELPGRPRLPVGLTALVVEAAAALLPAYGELNGAWGGEAAVRRRRVHIAVGEPGPAGLRWALVRDAGDLTARGLARALAGADGGVDEATFAVVSLADGASWQSAAPPLAGTSAALSVGAPASRAVAVHESVAVRSIATLALSYDARLIDHCRAAAFLRALCIRLERGSSGGGLLPRG